jgi:sialidase-1
MKRFILSICIALIGCLCSEPAIAQFRLAPMMEKQDLFVVGDDPAYDLYHIPGLVVTDQGTVIAWCEARKGKGDWSDIKILMRRSEDQGKTWSPPVSIAQVPDGVTKNAAALALPGVKPTDITINNPVMIDGRDGVVHLLYCVEYARCFYQRSDDDGVTWSKATEITQTFESFRDQYDWKVIATGPNHGLNWGNRLIVPVWLSLGTGEGAHRPSVVATIYSEDEGKSWKAGEIAIHSDETFINPSESLLVPLDFGDGLLLNARNESDAHRRINVISENGISGWSKPQFDKDLVEPICNASLIGINEYIDSYSLYFCNPNNLDVSRGQAIAGRPRARKNLTMMHASGYARSIDELKWTKCRTIEESWSAYSDLAYTSDGTFLCFYGRSGEEHFAGDRLTLARFNHAWLFQKD